MLADEPLRQVVIVCLVNGLPAKVEAVFPHHGALGVRAPGSREASKQASIEDEFRLNFAGGTHYENFRHL